MNEDVIAVTPLLHFKKPEIGVGNDISGRKSVAPLQIALPTGHFGVGVSVARLEANAIRNNRQAAVIMSSPGDDEVDKMVLWHLKLAFLFFAGLNFIITAIMYARANQADPVSVSPYSSAISSVFDKPSDDRTYIQRLNFGFFILLLIIAVYSTIAESALGLSMYAFAITLNFLLSISALPYFLFSFRYIIDMVLLYLSLVLRSRVVYIFLPRNVFDLRDILTGQVH